MMIDTLDALNDIADAYPCEDDADVRYERNVEACMLYPWIQWTTREERTDTDD